MTPRPRALILARLSLALLGVSPWISATTALAAPLAVERTEGSVRPIRELQEAALTQRRAGRAYQVGDTTWVFRDSLENKSSPSNEGGWTHADASFQPTVWHIDTIDACQGHAFWCGLVDSSWVNDPNRRGYDNNWTQILQNFVNVSGAQSPVMIGFRHQMDAEPFADFGQLEVLDPEFSWIPLANWTGSVHGSGGAPCDTFSVQIPDSILAKTSGIGFRFVFTSDIQGSSSDGLYTAAEGWSIDNVTVKAGLSDLRFFDDFEFGIGTWSVSTFPAVGDNWRIGNNLPAEQLCVSNQSKVWTVTNPVSGALTPRMDDKLMSPAIAVNHADQVTLAFDVYRSLPSLSCFYYNIQIRTRNAGSPWSSWAQTSSQVYFGNEKEWMRQTLGLPGAAAKDSLQFMIDMKDYSAQFCGGISSTGGTLAYFDNFGVGTVGLSAPTIVALEQDLFQDTFQTAPFFGSDNFNTPRGDSTSVRLSASRGVKQASMLYSLNGGAFTSVPLVAFGPTIPTAYFADVPAATYARGSQLRYYFSVTDSLDAVATLPSDALTASHYFTATVLPAIQSASATCTGDTARILYVNAWSGLDGAPAMTQTLTALGLRFDRYDVNAPVGSLGNAPGGSPAGDPIRLWPATSAATLGMYQGILWDVGERSSSTLTAEDQNLLQSWINLPGSNRGLILAGDNLAYDLSVNAQDIGTFLSCTMGSAYSRDIWENVPQDSLAPTLKGAAGTRIAQEPFPLDGQCPGVNRFDAITIHPCLGSKVRNWITYPNTYAASIETRDSIGVVADTARTVLLGFGLGSMPNTTRRNYLLYRTLTQEFEIPGCYVATGVDEPSAVPAARAVLHEASPNPFNPFTTIRFELGRPARIRITIFDVSGARVRTLGEGMAPAGEHQVHWDGTDDHGRKLASGAYFFRLWADGDAQAQKLILLR